MFYLILSILIVCRTYKNHRPYGLTAKLVFIFDFFSRQMFYYFALVFEPQFQNGSSRQRRKLFN